MLVYSWYQHIVTRRAERMDLLLPPETNEERRKRRKYFKFFTEEDGTQWRFAPISAGSGAASNIARWRWQHRHWAIYTCRRCGVSFQWIAGTRRRFCSTKCRVQAWRATKRQETRPEVIDRTARPAAIGPTS
jgi:hypothetical protein